MAKSPGGVEVARISTRVVADTSRLFDELKADLAKIEARSSITVRTKIDSTALDADARAAVEQAQLAAGDLNIKAKIDTSQIAQAEAVFGQLGSSVGSVTSGFSLMAAGGVALGLALIPLTAVVGGLVAALTAPLAIVGGGLTVFGLIAGLKVNDVLKQQKAIAALQTKLDGLTKGTSAYADTQQKLANAQDALKASGGGPFVAALDAVKGALAAFPTALVLKPITDGLKLLAKALPLLTPVVKVASGALDTIVRSLDGVVSSKGFRQFVDTFAKQLGPDLKAFARIAGNIFIGLGGLFGALGSQLSGGVLKGLENLTGQFADFGKKAGDNKGLKSFTDYVKRNMPKVGQLIGNVFGLVGDLLGALAPLGQVAIDAFTGITGALRDLGQAAGPLTAILAGFGVGSFLGGPEVGAAVAAVLALVGGFQALYQNSKPLRRIIHDIGDYFTRVWVPQIKDAAQHVMPALQGAVKSISDTIRDNKGLFEVLGKALAALGGEITVAAIYQVVAAIKQIAAAFRISTEAVKAWADLTLSILQFAVQGVGLFVAAVLNQFAQIVDGAAAAFGWLPKVGGPIKKAQQNFHDFESTVNGNIASVGLSLGNLKHQIDEVGSSHPDFTVIAHTTKAIRDLERLQAFRIKDKTFDVTWLFQQRERAVGPGGGIGQPAKNNGGGSGGGAAGRTAPQVNVEKMFTSDTNDILRKSQARARTRSGGGVLFPPPRIPAFTGG